MRVLSDYSASEWLKAVPLAQRLRRARNVLVDRVYRDRRAEGQDALVERLAACDAPALAFTVAFNMPGAISLLADAMARFVPRSALVVCDNSTDPAARETVSSFCRERGIFYCALPPSPYRGARNGSRSHAVALNWVTHNLVRPAAPKVFAFIDHDLVPLAPADLAALVAGQPCYGLVRHSERGDAPWYLWPGYSVFDFEVVRDFALDFGTDTPLTLDTGGQNWTRLYRHLDLAQMRQALRRRVFLDDLVLPKGGASTERRGSMLVDETWFHIGGAGHRVGGVSALERLQVAFAEDPDGLLARLVATSDTPLYPG